MKIEHEVTKNHIMYSRKQLAANILHWHESIELCRSIEGEAKFLIDNKTYVYNKGDIVIIPSKCLHCYECDGKNKVDIFLIPTHDFMPIIRHYPSIPIHIPYEKILSVSNLNEQIDYLFSKLNETYSLNIPFSKTLSLTYALSIASLLLMNFPPKNIVKGKNWKHIQPVFDEIKRDCTNPEYSLNYFAKKLNYAPEYFSLLFKTYAGIGFKDFLDRQRINEAKRILISEFSSINEVAEHCGFKNIRTFNNRFRALEKMTPSEFIELYNSKNYNDIEEIL